MHKHLPVLFLLTLTTSSILADNYAFKKAMRDFKQNLKLADEIVDKNIDKSGNVMETAIAGGITVGAAKVITIAKAEAAATWVATKGAVIVAGPYIAGGAALLTVCYGGYKYYQSCQPSAEKIENERVYRDFQSEKKFEHCLHENEHTELNARKFPTKCEEEFKNFILIAGKQRADIKLEAFHEFAGISTSKF